ncbi:MAG: RNA 3'-terminal phosphate cyclase [Methanomicrobiales archaeon]|nr:RNA 3'-terminal phosphate cyclase [Methanomicrobiales archaeon]
MLTIDGSRLEGGGQIVRTAVALSALTSEPVRIVSIRAKRPVKGLAAQHLAAVKAVAMSCDAVCTGLSVGSGALVFEPGKLKYREISLDIGTAGSISLVLQAWLPVGLAAGGTIRIAGGTEVEHSPTIDYMDAVLFGVLRRCGAEASLKVNARGYYPEGGGEVVLRTGASALTPIAPQRVEGGTVSIVSCTQNLPDHVAARQAESAAELLQREGLRAESKLERRRGRSTGSSCTISLGAKGACALGKRGLPAEKVGRKAAERFLEEFRHDGSVDTHLSDQLLVFLARAGGEYTCSSFTMHAQTVCWLFGEFGLDVEVTGDTLTRFSA